MLSAPSRETVHKDGNFRIAEACEKQYLLEHRCERGVENEKWKWSAHAWSLEWSSVRCLYCQESASDGLRAVFTFMKGA